MPTWLQTTIGVLTAFSLISAVAIKPLSGYFSRLRKEWTGKFEELQAENTKQHTRTDQQLTAISGTLRDIGQHFDEDAALSKEVGTLPARVRNLEAQIRTLDD